MSFRASTGSLLTPVTGAATGVNNAPNCSNTASHNIARSSEWSSGPTRTGLSAPLDWLDATLVSGNGLDVVARLKETSEVPLRSHGSLSLNRALMAAGLVDRVQVTIFPVITGHTGEKPIFQGASDFDLELIENRTLDGHTQELIYRPILHGLNQFVSFR